MQASHVIVRALWVALISGCIIGAVLWQAAPWLFHAGVDDAPACPRSVQRCC